MAVTVYWMLDDENFTHEVQSGESWSIDNHGNLHVLGADGGVASFARGRWDSVQHGGSDV